MGSTTKDAEMISETDEDNILTCIIIPR